MLFASIDPLWPTWIIGSAVQVLPRPTAGSTAESRHSPPRRPWWHACSGETYLSIAGGGFKSYSRSTSSSSCSTTSVAKGSEVTSASARAIESSCTAPPAARRSPHHQTHSVRPTRLRNRLPLTRDLEHFSQLRASPYTIPPR